MITNSFDNIDPRELGKNLKHAREQRGLKQAEAAKIIKVARTTLTAIEQGQRRIKIDELMQLTQAYGRSISGFMRPRPVIRDFKVQFRGPLKISKEARQQICHSQNEFQELCRDYVELENIMEAPLIRSYPEQYNIKSLKIAQAAEGIATQERNRLGLGDGPLPILRNVFEQTVGLRIFYLPLQSSQFSEMYYYDDELGGCLAVNQNHPEERRRWSLAHGYAHFLQHRYQPSAYVESKYQREQFADYFAKYFLMPSSGLTRQYNAILQSRNKPTIADLCVLANYYGVSLSALVYRLEDMAIAPLGTWERLQARGFKVKEAQKQLSFTSIPEQSQLLPLRYQYLAVEAFEEGKISEGLLAKFLRVDRLQARSVVQALANHSSDITNDTMMMMNLEDFATV